MATAQKMVSKEIPAADIIEMTGLSEEEIEVLQAKAAILPWYIVL